MFIETGNRALKYLQNTCRKAQAFRAHLDNGTVLIHHNQQDPYMVSSVQFHMFPWKKGLFHFAHIFFEPLPTA